MRSELLMGLKGFKEQAVEKGLAITSTYVNLLIKKIENPHTSHDELIENFDLTLESYLVEMREHYPSHFMTLIAFSEELEQAMSSKKIADHRNENWDCLQGRGRIEKVGNVYVEIINQEKNPCAKTLLLGHYIGALYETGLANLINFVNFIMNDYEKGTNQDSAPLIQSALTLDRERWTNAVKAGKRSSFRCEICHIRNGFSHTRFDIEANGNLHVWDMKNANSVNSEKVFDEKYSLIELFQMTNEFKNRIELLDMLFFLSSMQTMIRTLFTNGYDIE